MSPISFPKISLADKWLVTVAVTLGMFMSLMDSTIVVVAIPQMQRAFGAGIHDVQWVVTIYMLTQAAVIPTAPYLTAKFGGKRVYIWTLTAFLLGSLLCGFAWNLPSLLLFRLIQGIGGGILLPMVMTLLYQAFPAEERGMATSVMGVPLMIAPVLGPVLGGYLVTVFGWPWAFFINVPLGIIAVIIAQKVLRHTQPEQRIHFDIGGFLTAGSGSAALVYGISAITSGDTTLKNVLFLFGGACILLAFVVIEIVKARRGQEPLLDLRGFQDPTFAFSNLALVFYSFVWFGLLFLIPIYLQTLHHETALQAGLIQGAQALTTLTILPIVGRLSVKIGPRPLSIVGLILLTVVAALMMTLALTTPIVLIVGILVLLGCASALIQQIPVAAMSRVEKEKHKEVAHGSTLVTVLRAVAAPMGVAVLSSIVQSQSQQHMRSLSAQGIAGELLHQQSTLLAMHESFFVAVVLALVALVAMCFVPRRNKRNEEWR